MRSRVFAQCCLGQQQRQFQLTCTCRAVDQQAVRLDQRSRMMYDQRHIFINGEAYRASGRDATLMRRLADERRLQAKTLAGASAQARELLQSWMEAGWLHAD